MKLFILVFAILVNSNFAFSANTDYQGDTNTSPIDISSYGSAVDTVEGLATGADANSNQIVIMDDVQATIEAPSN